MKITDLKEGMELYNMGIPHSSEMFNEITNEKIFIKELRVYQEDPKQYFIKFAWVDWPKFGFAIRVEPDSEGNIPGDLIKNVSLTNPEEDV